MSDNIILTDRHNGLVICTIPLVPLYKDMNGYVAIFIKIATYPFISLYNGTSGIVHITSPLCLSVRIMLSDIDNILS